MRKAGRFRLTPFLATNVAFAMEYGSLNLTDSFYVPDRKDRLRDKLKHAWRRFAFYLFLVFFCFFTIRLPYQIQSPSIWVWAVHTLYFELDIANGQNTILVRLFHAVSFCGAYIAGAFFVLVLITHPGWVDERARIEHHASPITWLVNILLHWLPPIWHALDIYLQRTELRSMYNIRLHCRGIPPRLALANSIKIGWVAVGAPLLCFVWRICGFSLESIYGISEISAAAIFIPVLSVVALLSSFLLLFLVRKPALSVEYSDTASVNKVADD